MKKIISLSITLFCFTHILQSCSENNPFIGHKPPIKRVIYSEDIVSPYGAVISEGSKVCLDPKTAESLPLHFTIKSTDGSSRKITWWGVEYVDGTTQDFIAPFDSESSSFLFFNCEALLKSKKKTYSFIPVEDITNLDRKKIATQKAPYDFFTTQPIPPLVFSGAHISFTSPSTTPKKTGLA